MAERLQRETIPLRKISDFKSKLTGGGARPNLFEVVLAFPTLVSPVNENEVLQKSRFLVNCRRLWMLWVGSEVTLNGKIKTEMENKNEK